MVKPFERPIYVTKPFLPPLKEFITYLEDIWDSKWLTNNARYHQQFEKELAGYLGVKYVSLFANGTLALVTTLKVLRITGEVITTPYTFPATTHALHWNGIKPVFCDIEPITMNIDPEKIEALITPKTTAILPVHVYGNPCDVERIEEIGDIYRLKVIYDACHAFGVQINGNSILNFGDISVLSFHATKVFTTMEGGAIISNEEKVKQRIDYLKNFGFVNETTIVVPGINAKMNEMQAALGLLQLGEFEKNTEKRKQIAYHYRQNLKDVSGLKMLHDLPGVKHNYAYFPIFIDEKEYGCSRDQLYQRLKDNNIYGRRYFYPLISQFSTYKGLPSAAPGSLPVAEKFTKQVICLPIYPDLNTEIVEEICRIIQDESN
jgi:dTDP-4-amino-4,6-dideoxygalactose transaminase